MKPICRAAFTLAAFTWAGGSAADEPAPSLLEAPAPIAAALQARFGRDLRVLRLSIRPEGAEVEVQDPAVSSHVDRYPFEEGALGTPEPVQVGRSQRALKARLFAFAEVDLSILPALLADARGQARTEEARATHVTIERVEGTGDYESWGRPLIRVHVDGPRGGAVVEYGLDGKRKGVTRW
jgi:hypothetical protein